MSKSLVILTRCTLLFLTLATFSIMPGHINARTAKPPATIVNDQSALEKLLGNTGVTVQWLSWTEGRGTLNASWRGKTVVLKGGQIQKGGTGKLNLDGIVVRIDKDSFIFRGTITMIDTPDNGRKCAKNGDSLFAITQNRKYWRMREFEWCDGLTDYIDIYF